MTGIKKWFIHGKLHREGGLPALINPDGSKSWYEHGLLHRVDGPALERANGIHEWWFEGVQYPDQKTMNSITLFNKLNQQFKEKPSVKQLKI